MSDGLIPDDERNKAAKPAPSSDYTTLISPPPSYGQPSFGQRGIQAGYGAPQANYGESAFPGGGHPSVQYVVPPTQPGYAGQTPIYQPGYPIQYQAYPQQYGGMQQPQLYPMPYGMLPPHAMPQYGISTGINQHPHQPSVLGTSDEKELVQSSSNSSQQPQNQPLPDQLSNQVVNVQYDLVQLHGENQDAAIKALLKANEHDTASISNILGTYLHKKRIHERNREQAKYTQTLAKGITPDILMYNDLMDKLESLSGAVLTKHIHRHSMNVEPWMEAMNPHRRAIFAELYNSNSNVRAFCAGMAGGPLQYPTLDDWALGKRKHNLSFQRANRRGPNWNVARELLSQVHTVILLDDSGSMAAAGHSAWGYSDYGSKSRWEQARDLLAEIAPLVSRYNEHGIDIHFLNHYTPYLGLHTTQDVQQVFTQIRPGGGTPTGRRMNGILDGYMSALRYNRAILPLNLIVITDGEAQDENTLHWAIEEHVTKIVHRGFQAHQFGIEFLQVGDDDEATRHLEKLEEEVSRHHHAFQRDVVGVTPTTRQSQMTSDQLLGIVLSGIDARMNGYMRHHGVNV